MTDKKSKTSIDQLIESKPEETKQKLSMHESLPSVSFAKHGDSVISQSPLQPIEPIHADAAMLTPEPPPQFIDSYTELSARKRDSDKPINSAIDSSVVEYPVKTLKGRDGYLFLTSDSNGELESHLHGVDSNAENRANRCYEQISSSIYVLVVPDKSVVCKSKLPVSPGRLYRPGLSAYQEIANIHLIDPTHQLLESDYYKTDTHINLKGLLKCFSACLLEMNLDIPSVFSRLKLNSRQVKLSDLGNGLGDLTWEKNRGDLYLNESDLQDTYYYSPQIQQFYLRPIKMLGAIDLFDYNLSALDMDKMDDVDLSWELLSSTIIRLKCEEHCIPASNATCLVFYDSSTIPLLDLVRCTFKNSYWVKSHFLADIVKKIDADFVLEMRTERFL